MTDNTSPKHNTMEKEIEINDPFFDELQAVWDEHRRRVDRIVAATDTLSTGKRRTKDGLVNASENT